MNCDYSNVIPLYEEKDKEINEFICKMGICEEIDVFSNAAQDKFDKFLQKHNLEQRFLFSKESGTPKGVSSVHGH